MGRERLWRHSRPFDVLGARLLCMIFVDVVKVRRQKSWNATCECICVNHLIVFNNAKHDLLFY